MKTSVFFLMIVTVFALSGCRKKTTIVEDPYVQKSEYIVKGNSESILKRVQKKYRECYHKHLLTIQMETNCIEITGFEIESAQSVCTESVSHHIVRIHAAPEFDATPMSQHRAEVLRMGIFDETGCPK